MLKGKIVNLLAIERDDLKQLMEWRNNPDFKKRFREYRELNMEMQEKWFRDACYGNPTTFMFAIRRASDNQLLGCCGLLYVNWPYRFADLSLYIGWQEDYIDNVGYAAEACGLLLSYAYDQLALNKIWTEVYSIDQKKKDFFEQMGFHIDGTMRDNYFYDGRFYDSYIFSMKADEWRKKIGK